ncbi:hypothetical protein TCAL_14418 [Tigriopus californicus]|uniref:Kelch repeat protein n=2 Tax=Tigriopus californicus TaxID=6832 RepID=A0A553PLV9_TIGCA|nr:hypothetical protein TCAL_14418 [Tigriopus californicus]
MIIGGRETGYVKSTNVEVIDMANEKHCPNQSSLPTLRYGMHAFILGSKLLILGGIGNYQDITSYNYENHLWESIGSIAADRSDYSVARIQDSWILILGGYFGSGITNTTLVFNANGSIIPGPDLPEPNEGFCACGLDDNHIFITGGVDLSSQTLRTTYVLDWSTQQWTNLDPMVLTRHYVECGTFLGTNQELNILVVGGLDSRVIVDPNTEIFNWPQRTWRAGPDFVYPEIFLNRMTSFDGKLFVFGGFDDVSSTFLSSIHTFIPGNESWVRFPLDMKIARRDFAIVKIPEGIVDC